MMLKLTLLLTLFVHIWTEASGSTSIGPDILIKPQVDSTQSATKYPRRWRRGGNNKPNSRAEQVEQANEISNHHTKFVAECLMPTDQGMFKMRSYVYSSPTQNLEPIVMVSGDISDRDDVLVRVHDQCFTSEVFGSKRCDCREQLHESLEMIQEQGGIVIYLQQEGRGIGIANKVAAYSLQDEGMDTVDANTHLGFDGELREYLSVPDILNDLGIRSIRLLTNNPYKIEQLSQLGVKISERIAIQVPSNPFNEKYLRSKKDKMRHFLSEDMLSTGPVDEVNLKRKSKQHQQQTQTQSTTTDDHNSVDATTTDSNITEITGGETVEEVVGKRGNTQDEFTTMTEYAFGRESVEAAISAIKNGKSVIVVDDANRENEGDLILAAEKATPENVGHMVRYSSGVICVSLESDRLDFLNLPPMVVNNEDPKQTAYTVSVDCKHNTTTGISASDRATTFRALVHPDSTRDDFQRPGHVFPLRYKPGGVLRRAGHTEASLDLTRLAGLRPGGVLAEIVNDDGSMMRLPGLEKMAKEQGLVLTSVQDIIAYRKEIEE